MPKQHKTEKGEQDDDREKEKPRAFIPFVSFGNRHNGTDVIFYAINL